MTPPRDRWLAAGQAAIRRGARGNDPLPWDFRTTVFRCAWEYPAAEFETEVGFYLEVFGFETIALNHAYALFTTEDKELTFACRRGSGELTGHTLSFMTREIESFAAALEQRLPAAAVQRRTGSTVQTVLELRSPAGLKIEVWEMPSNP